MEEGKALEDYRNLLEHTLDIARRAAAQEAIGNRQRAMKEAIRVLELRHARAAAARQSLESLAERDRRNLTRLAGEVRGIACGNPTRAEALSVLGRVREEIYSWGPPDDMERWPPPDEAAWGPPEDDEP